MRRSVSAVLLVGMLLPAALGAAPDSDGPPESNTTYQPTNEEWLVRYHDGQEPIKTLVGGPGNPRASLATTPEAGEDGIVHVGVGQPVVFDASASEARKGDRFGGERIVNWIWDFADGGQANAPIVEHRFTRRGTYHVHLTVHDDTGWRSQRDLLVMVDEPPCGRDPIEIRIPTGAGLEMHGYLTLPDGNGPFPTILEYGPYVPAPRGACDLMVREGYAMAHVSAPGRGRSTGEWDMFGRRTQRGGYDAVEWFAAQPWSNGRVGLWGISGPAVGALLTAGARPPHLEAVVAKTSYSDAYRDIVTAGGVPSSDTFVNAWMPLLTAQDAQFAYGYGDVAGVPGPAGPWPGVGPNGEVVDHAITNGMLQAEFLTRGQFDAFWDERAIVNYPEPTAKVLYYGNQHDLWPRATVELQRWIAPAGGRVISIPGGHAAADISGWAPGRNAFSMLAGETRLWFERHLKGIRNGVDERPAVLTWSGSGGSVAAGFDYGQWEQLDGFLGDEVEPLRVHLRAAGSNPTRPHYRGLSLEPAADGEPPAVLPYSPVQGATSDNTAALATQIAGAQEVWESHSLVYETPPLTEELHVNGPATAQIHARILAPDLAFTAHVNAVWPDGSSHYVAKGALLASHRQLDHDRSLWLEDAQGVRVLIRAYHPHTGESVSQLVPGQAYRFDIEVWGIHNVFREGHRLRLSLAAQDLGWRTHWTPGPAALVLNDPAHPSTLNLPVLPRERSREPFPYSDGGPSRELG